MKDIRLAITINKPAEVVFAFTLDPKSTPKWVDSIAVEETNESPTKLGTIYRNRGSDTDPWSELQVTAFEPNRRFVLSKLDGSYHVEYMFTPVDGGSRLEYYEWTDHGELTVPFTMKPLEKLKRILESTGKYIFISASYSPKVNYDTGEVFPEYKQWLEAILSSLEEQGNRVFCALRADRYRINDTDPAEAFSLDMQHIHECDAVLALMNDTVSAGVQTEIGIGVALGKTVIIAHDPKDTLPYFDTAMVRAGVVTELELPLHPNDLQVALRTKGN